MNVNWNDKLKALEEKIDSEMEAHGKKDVLAEIPVFAEQISNVQLRLVMGFVLSAPHLGTLPEDISHSRFNTVFDVITENMKNALIEHGTQYYEEKYN